MKARFVPSFNMQALEPDAPIWRGAPVARVKLTGSPLGLQPTAAIRAGWANKKIGAVGEVSVAAVHDGQTLAFRLEWADATQDATLDDTTSFPDAAAILLPSVPGAVGLLMTMGGEGLPVNAWYWRADEDGQGRQIVSEGLGTTQTVDREQVRARGVWSNGRWQVVIARALSASSAGPVAQLAVGDKTGYGIAIWEGSASERAGIKALSASWQELVLEDAPTEGR
jgi:DMSO reductase family type II enzyme heme b subunit